MKYIYLFNIEEATLLKTTFEKYKETLVFDNELVLINTDKNKKIVIEIKNGNYFCNNHKFLNINQDVLEIIAEDLAEYYFSFLEDYEDMEEKEAFFETFMELVYGTNSAYLIETLEEFLEADYEDIGANLQNGLLDKDEEELIDMLINNSIYQVIENI
jgi:hypothetical protein